MLTPIKQQQLFLRGAITAPTRRELEIEVLIASGLRLKEIAQKLGISLKTAETHRTRLYQKRDVHSVVQLIRKRYRLIDSLV